MPGTAATVPCQGLPRTHHRQLPFPTLGSWCRRHCTPAPPSLGPPPQPLARRLCAHVPWAVAHGYSPGGPVPHTVPRSAPSPCCPSCTQPPALPLCPGSLHPHSPPLGSALSCPQQGPGPTTHAGTCTPARPQGAPCPEDGVASLPWQHCLRLPSSGSHIHLLAVILFSL